MSDTDSFIDEVNEEVRRDRLFAMMRRYGWIAVLAIVAIVGGAAYSEFTRAQDRDAARALGDSLNAALERDGPDRAQALAGIEAGTPGGQAVLRFHRAAVLSEAGQTADAVRELDAIASDGDLPEIYRQIAGFKALTLQTDTLDAAARALAFEALAAPGNPLRLLAQEQLALIAVETGDTEDAIARFGALLQDAEASADLQQRASQAIVALGGTPPDRGTSQG